MKALVLYFLIFLVLAVNPSRLDAQGNMEYNIMEYLQRSGSDYGGLVIEMDGLVLDNLHRHILYNAKNPAVPGYRIRIFSESGFDSYDRAVVARTRFISRYENIEAYLQYDDPDFKVYIGDCRTRSEALKILEMIRRDFPYAFIVPQNINIRNEQL